MPATPSTAAPGSDHPDHDLRPAITPPDGLPVQRTDTRRRCTQCVVPGSRQEPGRGTTEPAALLARMVIGSTAGVDRWLARHGLPARTQDGGTLAQSRRALPHYGQQGWVTISGGRTTARGQWPAATAWQRVCPH